jgi:hypothetical protein
MECVLYVSYYFVLAEAHRIQTGVIEQAAPLLKLNDAHELNAEVFVPAARQAEESDRVLQAIKLYNLAGEFTTVISSLATALGTTLAAPGGGERARSLEATAIDIIRHYERMGRAPGRARDAVVKLLRVREALDSKAEGRVDRALEVSSHDKNPTHLDDACRLWSQRTLSHSMAMWQRSIVAQRNLRSCMILCSATYTRTSHSRWTPSRESIKRSRHRIRLMRADKWYRATSYFCSRESDLLPADACSIEKEVAFFDGLRRHATLSPFP